MKILIITDERTGGTSFCRICCAIIGGLCIDDINTHFDPIKNKDTNSWAYNFCMDNNIPLSEYFNNHKSFDEVNIFDMIIFLFNNGIDVFKLSINDAFWTEKQTQNLVNALNNKVYNTNLILLKLIRQNNFNKILSKCVAITLYEIIGDQSYDIKLDKYDIEISERAFKYTCISKLKTHDIINKIIVPGENVFVYETFYKNDIEVERLKNILKCNTIKDVATFNENYYKDYKSENVTIKNIDALRQMFNDLYYH